jgi:CHAT domain-containing protein
MKYTPPRGGQLRLGLIFLVIACSLSQWPSATNSMQQHRVNATDTPKILMPGIARAVETAREEPQVWQIQLGAGDYLRLMISSKQNNLKVKLIAPDFDGRRNYVNEEKALLSTTSQKVMIDGGEKQVATYLFIAAVSGNYQLETSSLAAIDARVKYEVEIERLRPDTADDRLRMDAVRTEMEGDVLNYKNGTPEDKRLGITKYKSSLALWRELGDRRSEARLLVQIGALYRGLGELHSTYSYHSQARLIAQELGDLRQVGNMTISIGIIQRGWGETQQALDSFNRARQIFASLSDHFRETVAIQSIGRVYLALGELRLAIGYFDQALQAFSMIGNTSHQCGVLNLLGLARRDLGEDRNALEYFQRALDLARKHGYQYQEGVALGGLGRVYLNLGEKETAVDHYNELLMMGRNSGDSRFIVDAFHALGNISYLSGEKEKALDYLSQSLALYRRMGWRQAEAQTLYELARIGCSMGNLEQARTQIEEALEIKESMRINVSRQDLRASFFSSAQNDFDLYIDLLMTLHRQQPDAAYDALALRASERARARGLLEQLTEINLDLEKGIDPKLQESARALQQQLNTKAAARRNAFGGPDSDDSRADSDREISELTSRYQELEAQMRVANPRYAALTRPQPLTVTEIQKKLLDDETVLLEFSLGEERSWLWAVTPQGIISSQLPPRSEIEGAARAIYLQLTARQPRANLPEAEQLAQISEADAKYQTAAQKLSDMLLGPIADSLLREWKDKRLLIVSDGALQYLPFGALPLPFMPAGTVSPTPLIAAHEIVNLPSASVLDVIRRETACRGPARKTLAVLADPVFEADDPRLHRIVNRSKREADVNTRTESFGRLPFSTEEANAIASFVPGESLLKATSFRASRMKAMSGELANYRIIHFATHGLLDSEHPELSGLVLSLVDKKGRSQDGFLRLHDIYNLRLTADTVVLSACQTALGKEIKGEGLIGLTRGFMYAGAQRVVASLWQIDDSATAAFMTDFYLHMLKDGRRPAAALRLAQLEIMKQKRWSSPYFWAGFVIQGEWR